MSALVLSGDGLGSLLNNDWIGTLFTASFDMLGLVLDVIDRIELWLNILLSWFDESHLGVSFRDFGCSWLRGGNTDSCFILDVNHIISCCLV